MRIFVTGATGVVGRALVPALLKRGHDVVGLARTDASRSMLAAMHAASYSGQGYEIERLAESLVPMHAVVHLAIALPSNDAAVEDDWSQSSKIIVGLLRHLLEASEMSGVRTVIFPSFFGVYGDHGEEWVTEESAVNPDPSSAPYLEAEQVLMEHTRARRSVGVVLRMGMIYGPEAAHTRGLLYALKQGQAPLGLTPTTFWPQVHVEDAAEAICLALEQSPAGQVFNICDDEPVRRADLLKEIAAQVGGPVPVPRGKTGELMPYMGRISAEALRASVRMSNARARQYLGFAPRFPNFREGYREVIAHWMSAR